MPAPAPQDAPDEPMSTATLSTQLDAELAAIAPGPGQAALAADHGVSVAADLAAVETLGVSLRELRLDVPNLAGASQQTLERWGADLCARVTYLLEGLGPLEYDPRGQELLIRSVPPSRDANATSYFEVMLNARGNGAFTLARYRTEPGVSRTREDTPLTRETLHRLVRDAVETIP